MPGKCPSLATSMCTTLFDQYHYFTKPVAEWMGEEKQCIRKNYEWYVQNIKTYQSNQSTSSKKSASLQEYYGWGMVEERLLTCFCPF